MTGIWCKDLHLLFCLMAIYESDQIFMKLYCVSVYPAMHRLHFLVILIFQKRKIGLVAFSCLEQNKDSHGLKKYKVPHGMK